MKKQLRKVILASSLLLASSVFAGIDNMSIKVGASNTTVGSEAASVGGGIGFEWSFIGNSQKRAKKGWDVYVDLGYDSTDTGYITKAALGGRYNVGADIWLGALAGVSGVSLTNNNNSTDLTGFMFGANTKYDITPNHGVNLEYRSASVTASTTGATAINADTIGLYYSYSF